MFIFYGEVLVHTIHITEYLTDAAFALGTTLRGDKLKLKLAVFYFVNIFCFFAGGVFSNLIKKDLILPVCGVMYLSAGIFYFVQRNLNERP